VKIRLIMSEDSEQEPELRSLIDRAVTESEVAEHELEVLRVRSDDDAKEVRCIGSPTIRIDGYDVEYAEREPPETSAGPRFYSTSDGWLQMPTVGMIKFAIREARQRSAAPDARA